MLPGQLFEELGFTYLGPFDGHNIAQLQRAIGAALNRRGPVLLHVYTQKGRGHAQAEENPPIVITVWGLCAWCRKWKPCLTVKYSAGLWQNWPEKTPMWWQLRPRCVMVPDWALLPGSSRTVFFDVGIAEQHALTLAAGMAKNGLRPFAAIYSTFCSAAMIRLFMISPCKNFLWS